MENVNHGFRLRGCLRTAAAIEAELTELVAGLTESQFHAPPRSGGWSIGYCIEHLILTGEAFLALWDAALGDGVRLERYTEDAPAYGWWRRTVLHYTENPGGFKRRVSTQLAPCRRRSIQETCAGFQAMHAEVSHRLVKSRCFDLELTRVQSPTISWLRYPLGFSFDLLFAHERRHLHQGWRVRQQLT